MNMKEISKFTCSVYKFVSPLIVEALNHFKISEYYLQQSKAVVSVEKKSIFFAPKIKYMENILDTYHFFSTPENESEIFDYIVKSASLDQEGRGSIYSESAILIENSDNDTTNLDSLIFRQTQKKENLMGIYCIIQRGKGDIIAQAALDTGSCVPSVYYGIGGGIRDRMGLMRITIPAEKEMVNIVVAEHDCMGLMNLLIDAGNLDRPGMGFIFCYPVNKAVVDTRSFIGTNRAAASISQVVTALDQVIGNTTWRKRVINPLKAKKRSFFENLENIMLICDDTKAKEMLEHAMSAGASGATISQCKKTSFSNDNTTQTKAAKEISDMVVGKTQRDDIIRALIDAGFFKNQTNGKIIVRKCEKAFSYVDTKKQ